MGPNRRNVVVTLADRRSRKHDTARMGQGQVDGANAKAGSAPDVTALLGALLTTVLSGDGRVTLTLPEGDRVVMLRQGALDDLEEAASLGRFRVTRRERQVLKLAAQDQTAREMAAALSLSIHTVHQHLASIRRRFAVTSTAAAVASARSAGLLSDEPEEGNASMR